jgi:hypothetical protein
MRKRRFVALALLAAASLGAWAEQISARWSLEDSQAVVGQSLTLTLEVQGADKFTPPDLTVPGVEVKFQGGGPRNSTSISIINGRTTKTVTKAWVGSWALKSVTPGAYHIDQQAWSIGGETVRLPAVNWQVTPAREDNRFALRQSLSQSVCVPGIELEYTLTWYLGQSAQNPDFTLPILDNPDLVPVESSFAPPPGDTFQLDYHGRTLTGTKSVERFNGQNCTALTIRFRVKPAKPGRYDLSGTLVSFEGAVDSRQVQDFFGNIINEPVYRTLVTQASPLVLTVKDLPVAGRPTPFSGLIGKLDLAWDATPGQYRVGEPIRLALRLTGVLNKPNLDLDHMVIAALDGADFQVSSDPTAKEAEGQRGFIVRARHAGKLTIPPLSINYFDPTTERYGTTATKALTFDIVGSSAAANGVSTSNAGGNVGSGDSRVIGAGPGASEGAASVGSQPSVTGATSPADLGGANVNPNGLPRPWWVDLAWWAFALPPLAVAVPLGAAGLWRHSARRRLLIARRAWRGQLAPLAAADGRPALEEGRARFVALLGAAEVWKARLAADGHWARLESLARAWDEAFFAEGREGEDWVAQWDAARREMEAWK